MIDDEIEGIAAAIEPLRGLFVVTMPDCLPYASWRRGEDRFVPESFAAYVGGLWRANRHGLSLVGAVGRRAQLTVESDGMLLLLREATPGFLAALVFDSGAALGMARIQADRLVSALEPVLVSDSPPTGSRGQRLLEVLDRYAPDTHAALLRVSLQTGLPLSLLRAPDRLSSEEFEAVASSVRRILGLERLDL
jgi:predicted regulator of Ras-like GTPase activity (Roadblock/LC7/MglB family)